MAGGGGAGGPSSNNADMGGGGAGGLLYKTGETLTLTNGSVTVTVGAGGEGGGQNGRGGGGGGTSTNLTPLVGGNGGSGGGDASNMGSGANNTTKSVGQRNTAASGLNAGYVYSEVLGNSGGLAGGHPGGGGGGAGGPGKNGSGDNSTGAAGTGGAGWRPADNDAVWIKDVTGKGEFARGGAGGKKGLTTSAAGNYGGGGEGSASDRNGCAGIVIVRFKRAVVKRETRYSHIPLAINPLKELHVFFNLGKFEPLMLADVKTDPPDQKLTLADEPAVRLWPRHLTDYYFSPIAFSQNIDNAYDPDNLYIGKPDPPHSYSIEKLDAEFNHIAFYSPLFFTSIDPLPQSDVDALLEFELKYQAFGAEASGGRVWTIKNGLYNTPDDVAELGGDGEPTGRGAGGGSYIPVKFGAGAPPGTVIYAK